MEFEDEAWVAAARDLWDLDPSVVHLNHGAFGATPRPVMEEQTRWRTRSERNPVAFFDRDIYELIDGARNVVASFVDADPAGFVFVPNATTGASTVLAALGLSETDEVVVTSHGYGAVNNAAHLACRRTGATLRTANIPLPLPEPDAIAGRIMDCVTPHTKLVVVDAVTSGSGAILPFDAVVAHCRAAGVATLVDAAHAPGMVDVSVNTTRPDFWIGNFHKWVCAPKGSAGLWIAADHRDRVRPLAVSHPHLDTLHKAFDWTGTHDPSAYLATPSAIALWESIGWDRIRSRNARLCEHGRSVVAAAIGSDRLVPPGAQRSLAIAAVPRRLVPDLDAASGLSRRLAVDHRIEAPVHVVGDVAVVRVSAQLYNRPGDYQRLASALADYALTM